MPNDINNPLDCQVTAAQQRLEALRQRFDQQDSADPQRPLLAEVLEAFSTSLEELHVAVEELDVQNQELLAARQALDRQRQRYQQLFDFAPDSYLVTDHWGVIREVNRAAEALLGKRRPLLLEKPLPNLLNAKDRRPFRRLLRQLRTENRAHAMELQMCPDQQDALMVAVTVTTITNSDGQTELLWLLRDISERKRTEERLHQLQAELMRIGRLNSLSGLASGLAHELNQPLTAIVSYTQACLGLLRSYDIPDQEVIETLERVAAQGMRAGQIIRRLRDFTRRRKCHREWAQINALIAEIVLFVSWQARRHRVAIRLALAEGLPPIVVDVIQIQQVLLNLLNNAIEALHDSPGQREIVIRTARGEANRVRVEVSDSGPGIAPDAIKHIFNPFFTTKSNGMGVGLNISRSIIEAHGGQLWATPNPERGVTFHFTVPIDPQGDES